MSEKDKKTKKKKLQYFTLTEKIETVFEKYVDENFIDKSKFIEALIVQYFEKNNKKI